jgi:hypothetical protein
VAPHCIGEVRHDVRPVLDLLAGLFDGDQRPFVVGSARLALWVCYLLFTIWSFRIYSGRRGSLAPPKAA